MFDNNIYLERDPSKCDLDYLLAYRQALQFFEPSRESNIHDQWILAMSELAIAISNKMAPATSLLSSLTYDHKFQNCQFRIIGGLVVAYPNGLEYYRLVAKLQVWLEDNHKMSAKDSLDWINNHLDRHRSTRFESPVLVNLL